MRFTLKLAIMVAFSFLLIAVGVLLYPLAQEGSFERRYVDAREVTEIGEGFSGIRFCQKFTRAFERCA